ncbi:hypothetical protein NKJ90_10595 [Mesorhizobium sp. M0051]|uniref:hypothetical protein n=1 Tax=unclassified Mesorhizobium TaxID=325217 RepID=UPI0003CEA04C|nr:hypothetical protein [Mesorhizobium sp. LNHC252B00]ESY62310.1 hypothetical protein X743_34720 [Mesorhizobium sp. LNHC252B00]
MSRSLQGLRDLQRWRPPRAAALRNCRGERRSRAALSTWKDLAVVGSGLIFEEHGEMEASGLPGVLQFFSVKGADAS